MLLRRLLYPLLLAPATEAGALEAMNAALEAPEVAPPPAAGGDDGGDQGGEGGEAAGGEGGEAGSEERAGAPGSAAPGEGAAGEQAGEEGADGGEGGAEGAAAPKPGEPGSRHRADGTFKSKDELERDAAAISEAETRAPAKGGKPAADGKPDAGGKGKKVGDPINDPIPDEVQGRTRARIESLVATTKELNTKLEAASAELESGRELFGMIEATGADAQTFARHMDVLALMHSSDPGERQQAVKALRAAADKIGQELGETPAGQDPLEGHPDLLEEVEAGEITRKRAEELAQIRNRDKAAEKLRTDAGNRESEQQAAQRKREETKTALNALSAELAKRDGKELYARKHAILVPFIRRLNPAMTKDQVVVAVREAYEALKLGPAAQPAGNGNRAPAGAGARQPARALQGAGAGGAKAPSSALEAMDLALDEHARTSGRVA